MLEIEFQLLDNFLKKSLDNAPKRSDEVQGYKKRDTYIILDKKINSNEIRYLIKILLQHQNLKILNNKHVEQKLGSN